MDVLTALLTVLDQVDYTRGNCSPTEMVGNNIHDAQRKEMNDEKEKR